MTVKELVNLGPIMQMVRVGDYDPTFIIKSSVFARDLKTQLSIVLNRAVNRQEKNCFMVIGNYGSGKSHFLAFLGALLKNPDKWELFTEQLLLQQEPDEQKLNSELIQSGKKLSDKRFFVVEYALDVINLPLADIFYDRIKRSLSEKGIEIKFEQSEYDHKDRMEKILSSISKINNGEKVTLAVIFDEMADWLASKTGASLRADLSFLRSIGELSKTHDFMFFTSLQEDMLTAEHEHIEAFGDEVMRILERFEKITIVAQNVKKVASHRLLKKNKDQMSRLQKLYSSMKKKLPLFNVDETEFCELYPVHPLVFDVFERMLRYLSSRGVLVYIHDAVEKILNQPVDTLVTVDQLFLAHRDSLKSVPKCAPYVIIYDNLTGDVLPRVDNDLRDMARKALDAIILLSIIDRNLTVTELANAILKAEFDGKMNYDALASALKELAGKSGQYFDITGSGIDAVYKIVQSEGPDVESLIRTKSATLDDNDHRIATYSIASHFNAMLDKNINPDQEVKDEFLWKSTNTRRPGKIWYVTKPIDWSDVEEKLTYDTDFLLIITSPFVRDDFSRSDIRDDRVALWRPSMVDPASLAQLKRDLAIRLLLNEKSGDESITNQLRNRLSDLKKPMENVILYMYYKNGEIGGAKKADIDISLFASQFGALKGGLFGSQFDELKSMLFDNALNNYYSKHPQFKATFTKMQSNKLILEFISNREAPNDESTLASYIQNFAEPMDLCISAGKFILNAESSYVKELEHRIERENVPIVDLKALSRQLRQKPYGLLEPAFELIFATLYRTGRIVLRTLKGEKFQVNRFEDAIEYGLSKFEAVEKSGVVSDPAKLRNILIALGYNCEPINSLDAQNNVWKQALLIPEKYDINRDRLTSRPFPTDELLGVLDKNSELLSPIFDKLNTHNSPKEAFEDILSYVHDVNNVKSATDELLLLKALADDSFELASADEYLEECAFSYLDEDIQKNRDILKGLLNTELVNPEKRKVFFDEFDKFKKAYVDEYVYYHEITIGDLAPFGQIEQLEASKEFVSLKMLSILRLQVEASFIGIANRLNEIEGKKCDKLNKEKLYIKPLCDCRFPITGFTDVQMELNDIKKVMSESIQQYEKAILNEADTIKANIDNVESQEAKALIQDFLMKKHLQLPVSEMFVSGINQALVKIAVVEIDFDVLKGKIVSDTPLTWRKFKQKLSEEVEKNFPKDMSDDSNVRVVIK